MKRFKKSTLPGPSEKSRGKGEPRRKGGEKTRDPQLSYLLEKKKAKDKVLLALPVPSKGENRPGWGPGERAV